jgi:hypothetical protein
VTGGLPIWSVLRLRPANVSLDVIDPARLPRHLDQEDQKPLWSDVVVSRAHAHPVAAKKLGFSHLTISVMLLFGHKSYQSFSIYLHKTDVGAKRACLILEGVDGFLTALGTDGTLRNDQNANAATAYPLTSHRNAYPARITAS